MQSSTIDLRKKAQLAYDFGVLATWAMNADPKNFTTDIALIAQSAPKLRALTEHSFNPAEAMRKASHLVPGMDAMTALGHELHLKHAGDADRTNSHLRTAIRRVGDVRNKDVWHIQLT